jgi:uncharacterized damage-inducible protein DinB
MTNQSTTTHSEPVVLLTPQALLKHWQGHRKLGRKVIEAFPEKELFEYSIGGMRTYAGLVKEMLTLADGGSNGLTSGNWDTLTYNGEEPITTKQQLLQIWDAVTIQLDNLLPQIPAEHYHDTVMAFGQYEGIAIDTLFYIIDNEVHHRAQGYVYLRALNIEPPAFWDRY